MSDYKFSPQAKTDVEAIFEYIAEHNQQAAERFVDQLEQTSSVLAENPRMGSDQSLLAPNLRGFPVQRYVLFFRPAQFGIEIVRVIHGSRDYDSLFEE